MQWNRDDRHTPDMTPRQYPGGATAGPQDPWTQDAVAVLMQHFNDHSRARPTGQMLTVIDNLVDVVEAQLDSPDCTGLMVERARLEFRRRVDAGEVINVKKTA